MCLTAIQSMPSILPFKCLMFRLVERGPLGAKTCTENGMYISQSVSMIVKVVHLKSATRHIDSLLHYCFLRKYFLLIITKKWLKLNTNDATENTEMNEVTSF